MKLLHPTQSETTHRRRSRAGFTAVSSALLVGLACSQALADDAARLNKLESENDLLRQRLDELEVLAKKEGLKPSGVAPVKALSSITVSGFVQASYFYNTREPADGKSDGYLWNASHNSFSLNKVKLTLASGPVAKDKWDAGFRTSLLWGEDTPNLNTGIPDGTGLQDIREAYVELNAPVGTGLNIRAGHMISLLNYESGDGGAANENFSQGFQWWFTGNGPATGVQLGYDFTDHVGLKVRVQNGMFDGPVDSNDGKALLASLGLKPMDKLWVNLIGWYSQESPAFDVMGASSIGGYKATDKLGVGWELDYFHFDNTVGTDIDLFSAGGWLSYTLGQKTGLAFRADYIDQSDGVLGPAVRPGAGITSFDTDGNLGSLTLTLNYKPVPALKIQPEVRYDYTSYSGVGGASGALDGKKDRVIIGVGASYSF